MSEVEVVTYLDLICEASGKKSAHRDGTKQRFVSTRKNGK